VDGGSSQLWRAQQPDGTSRPDTHAPFDLDEEVVRLIKARLIELPTYPGVALQLQRVISSDNYGLDDLVRLVESDAALASHVLRAANSAFFHATTPVTTLSQAISRVGAATLSNIAIAGTLGVEASIDGPLAAMRRDRWRRSLFPATVQCCSVADDGCVIELKPFALSGETATGFNQLVKRAGPALAA